MSEASPSAAPAVTRDARDERPSVPARVLRWDSDRWGPVVSGGVILVPLLLWTAALWPAVFNGDSVDTWNQAAGAPIVAWHPPTYTYLQKAAHLLVESPWPVILVQCLAMAWAMQRMLEPAVRLGLWRLPVAGFGSFVATLPPVGAFTTHLIKDVPYAVGFLLVVAFLASAAVDRLGVERRVGRRWTQEVILGLGLWLMLTTRPNALLTIALMAAAIVVLSLRRWVVVVVIVAAVGAQFTLSRVVYPALDVLPAPEHLKMGAYVYDLGALWGHDPEQVPEDAIPVLEYYATQTEWREEYECHWFATPFQSRFYQYPSLPRTAAEMGDAWQEAMLADPFYIIGNHLCAASPAWNPYPAPEEVEKYQTVLDRALPNKQGIESDPLSDRWGAALRDYLSWVGDGTVSQILLWRAPTWVYLSAILLVVAAVRSRRWVLLWLLLPFAAQAAGVIAMRGPHYRYMAAAWIGAVLLLPLAATLAVRPRLAVRHEEPLPVEATPGEVAPQETAPREWASGEAVSERPDDAPT